MSCVIEKFGCQRTHLKVQEQKGDPSDVVFKEWCTVVLILPLQERSRGSTVLFGQWPKTQTKS